MIVKRITSEKSIGSAAVQAASNQADDSLLSGVNRSTVRYLECHLLSKLKSHNADGFALIATISVMVLLVMIALAMLSLSTISLRSSSHEKSQTEARANARLGLMLAIAQLQTELGPDQRINAPADLMDDQLSGGRERWVGTWDSWAADDEERPEPQFRRWLVSGNPESLGNESFPASASNLVPLIGSESSVELSAPRVPLPNGSYAYAVIDESAKARIGTSLISDSLISDSEDLAEHLNRWQAPPSGHGALPGLESVSRNDEAFNRVVSNQSVDLLPMSGTRSLSGLRSYTVWSEGLLTDVRNGGLRKDLSLHFDDPASGDDSVFLYEHLNYLNEPRGGINFRELRNFHEVSSSLTYNPSGFNHPDGGDLNDDVPFLVGPADKDATVDDPFFVYKRPIVLRAAWNISAFSQLVTTGDDDSDDGSDDGSVPEYEISIVLEPIIWLWNPFDANLVMQPGGHLTSRCWGLPYDVTIQAGGVNRLSLIHI